MNCGVVLIVVGGALLLQNIEIISYDIWELLLPIGLIAWGFQIFRRGSAAYCCVPFGGDDETEHERRSLPPA